MSITEIGAGHRHILTDDERDFPKECPPWCEGRHRERLLDEASMWDACTHFGPVGEASLAELHNGMDGRVWREGCGGYSLALIEEPHPYNNLGRNGEALVVVRVDEAHDRRRDCVEAEIRLTTGEARVLAARLISAADKADEI